MSTMNRFLVVGKTKYVLGTHQAAVGSENLHHITSAYAKVINIRTLVTAAQIGTLFQVSLSVVKPGRLVKLFCIWPI